MENSKKKKRILVWGIAFIILIAAAALIIRIIYMLNDDGRDSFYYPVDDYEYLGTKRDSKIEHDAELEGLMSEVITLANQGGEDYYSALPKEINISQKYSDFLNFGPPWNDVDPKDFNLAYIKAKSYKDKAIVDFYVTFSPGKLNEDELSQYYLRKIYLFKDENGKWTVDKVFKGV